MSLEGHQLHLGLRPMHLKGVGSQVHCTDFVMFFYMSVMLFWSLDAR
jgi:hypothetical protein